MKRVHLAYGTSGLDIDVPDQAVVLEPVHLSGLMDEKGAVQTALRAPLGSLPLKDVVRADDSVAVVISDMTRPTPNEKLVAWILEELAHVPRERCVIINGVGSHRPNTPDELRAMLGQDVMETCRVINHDSFNNDELVEVGTNSYGSRVFVNKTYMACSFKIAVGFIEPHFFAGFSGGPKAINPGIAGIETILDFHNAQMIGHPKSTWGLIDGNILQDAATQNCLMAKPDFLLNVTLNGSKQITGVYAGELLTAHRAGCEEVKRHSMISVDAPFDIVITTNSGYPLDQNLYQTVKGISAASEIVKKGGAIICASECSDGVPAHGNFGKMLQMRDSAQELLDMIEEPSFRMFDQWQVQKQAIIQTRADCYIYSSLDDATIRNARLAPCHDIQALLAELVEKYGPYARIAVLPLGPLTIPYIL